MITISLQFFKFATLYRSRAVKKSTLHFFKSAILFHGFCVMEYFGQWIRSKNMCHVKMSNFLTLIFKGVQFLGFPFKKLYSIIIIYTILHVKNVKNLLKNSEHFVVNLKGLNSLNFFKFVHKRIKKLNHTKKTLDCGENLISVEFLCWKNTGSQIQSIFLYKYFEVAELNMNQSFKIWNGGSNMVNFW